MNTYSIKNASDGTELGIYSGDTPAQALDASGEDGSDLRVTLVANGRTAREAQAFRDGYAEGFRYAASGLDDEPITPAGMRNVSSLDSDAVKAIKLAAVAADGAGQKAGRIDGAKRRAGDLDFNGEGSSARAAAVAEAAWLAIESARLAYNALCESIGSDPIAEVSAILSIGREFLPPCAIAVLDDRDAATVEYYEFLTAETEKAQAEHDRDYAAGR